MDKCGRYAIMVLPVIISACAGLRFNKGPQDNALTYYEPTPFAAVKVAADCTTSVDVITLPGRARSVAFRSGFGSAKLNVTIANGMITTLGQETDTKIPETITAVAGLAKTVGLGVAAGGSVDQTATCKPSLNLYEITYNERTSRIDLDKASSLAYQALVDQRAAIVTPSPTPTPSPSATPKM